MSGVTLFLLTFLFILVVFAGVAALKRPVYRLTHDNLIKLFDLVLAGEASEDDWNVFVEMPIRYNDDLELVRLECAEIADNDGGIVPAGFLLSKPALEQLAVLRDQMKR